MGFLSGRSINKETKETLEQLAEARRREDEKSQDEKSHIPSAPNRPVIIDTKTNKPNTNQLKLNIDKLNIDKLNTDQKTAIRIYKDAYKKLQLARLYKTNKLKMEKLHSQAYNNLKNTIQISNEQIVEIQREAYNELIPSAPKSVRARGRKHKTRKHKTRKHKKRKHKKRKQSKKHKK